MPKAPTIAITLLMAVVGCIEPYPLPSLKTPTQWLVVDGFINASANKVLVRLSRTVSLQDTLSSTSESEASVLVRSKSGESFSVPLAGEGLYEITHPINRNELYQLEIQSEEDLYQSEFIPVLTAPEIDSVNWKPDGAGTSIHLSTHDPDNNTRFYLWNYSETWEYRAAFQSSFIYDRGSYIYRLPEEDIYHCWRNQESSEILIGSTNQLNQDIVSEAKITHIPDRSEKLLQKYSILIRQLAITADSYDFWQQLKKNTESLGTLFDPQPSQVTGNIFSGHSTPVIGYFYASTVTEKRLTVEINDLPNNHRFVADLGTCLEDTVLLADLPKFESTAYNLVVGVYSVFGQLIGFRYATHYCTECELQGGSRNRPDFW